MSTLFSHENFSEAHTFPELPKLSAGKRAELFTYIMLLFRELKQHLKITNAPIFMQKIDDYFTTIVEILLDGCSTVEEFLRRDTSRKYEIVCSDIIVEENGVRSFICPRCGKQVNFPADDERYMDEIRKRGCVTACCPDCSYKLDREIGFYFEIIRAQRAAEEEREEKERLNRSIDQSDD